MACATFVNHKQSNWRHTHCSTKPLYSPNNIVQKRFLDLKYTFFCRPLELDSQTVFAFEWENPMIIKNKICWTVLPQVFKNILTIFGIAWEGDLNNLQGLYEGTLLQYVDKLFLLAPVKGKCLEQIINLLSYLGMDRYWVSQKKGPGDPAEGVVFGAWNFSRIVSIRTCLKRSYMLNCCSPNQKLTLGQSLMVFVTHEVLALMDAKGICWLSPSWMGKYQPVLVDQGDIQLSVVSILNLAMLLPAKKIWEI